MRSLRPIALLLLFCGVLGCQQAEAQYLHPKIKEKKVTVRSAVILPAKVELTKESAKGSEMMVAESEEASVKVVDAVAQALQEKKRLLFLIFKRRKLEPYIMDSICLNFKIILQTYSKEI